MVTKSKITIKEVAFSKSEIKGSQIFSKQEKDQIEAILKNDYLYTIEETKNLLKKEQRRVVV